MKQNAVDYMKEKIDIEKLLTYYGVTKMHQYANNIRCTCPIHKGNNPTAFVFNKSNNLWYCHTGCKTGGDAYDLVMMMENIEFVDAVKRIAEIFDIDINDMVIAQRGKDALQEAKEWIKQMLSICSSREIHEYDIEQLGHLYPINSYRQYTKETLEYFNVKYCKSAILKSKDKEVYVNDRIVVPIYQNNKLVGVTMRTAIGEQIKWMHQPSGINTGDIIYNIDNIQINEQDAIILTEGCPDTWNVHQSGFVNVVGLFGAHLTANQEKTLLTKTYKVLSALDADYAGIKAAIDMYGRLRNKMTIQFIDVPLTYDIGELNDEEVKNLINNPISFKQWLEHEYVFDIAKGNYTMRQWNAKYKENKP